MKVYRFDDESNSIYKFRLDFINKYSHDFPETKEKDLIKYSKIVANIKYKKCKYEPKIYHSFKKYL